ncbi:MAG: ThiF family adenylyltransferase [Thermoplasmata archaeon]
MKRSDKLKERYSRQMLLQEIGEKGQEKLSNSSITVVGLGALGSTIANNLVRAGIGKIKLVDRDIVEIHNLHRQLLFDEEDVGKPKAVAVAKKLKKINSDVQIESLLKDFNFSNAESVIRNADVVLDGTDNMETRFLINDACVKNKIPWIYGGAVSTYGMSMNIIPEKTSCFRCLVPFIQKAGTLPTCDTVGVLGAVPVIIGSIESVEAVKILLGKQNVNRNLIVYDVWSHSFKSIDIPRNKNCICCGKHNFEFLNVRKRSLVTVLCGKKAVQIMPIEKGRISLENLSKRLEKVGTVKKTKFALTLKLQKFDITIFSDGRAMIKGTNSENIAKSLYAKYIGT